MFRSIGVKILAATLALALGVAALVTFGGSSGGKKASAVRPASAAAPLTVAKDINSPAELSEAVSARLRAHDNVGPHVVTEAAGLDPSSAQSALTLQTGQHLGVLSGNGVKCIVGLSGADTMADHCYTPEQIESASDIAVYNACGTNEPNVMEITGFAPGGVAGVRLKFSDGTSQDTTVAPEGAFKFDGTTPTSSNDAPHPTSIVWLGTSGDETASHRFPVSGSDLCPGG